MNTYEDDEFKRVEMEQRLREKQKEIFGIPFVTQEELEQLLKDYDEIQTPSNT
jgi:transcription initiation factor TFIID subunit TAF12